MSYEHQRRINVPARTRAALTRSVVETLERRQLLSALTDNLADAANVEQVTAVTSVNSTVTDAPDVYGPLAFPFVNGQAKREILQPDGKRLVIGYFSGNWAMARYNYDGTLDMPFGGGDGKVTTDFGTTSDRAVNATVADDGKIILTGLVSANGNDWEVAVARYNTDGSLDSNFANGGKLLSGLGQAPGYGAVIVLLKDGRIHITGFDGSTSKAMEFDEHGRNGFDRMANLNATLHTQEFRDVPTTPFRGTFERYARMPLVGPVQFPSSGLLYPASDELNIEEGTPFSITVPPSQNINVNWGDNSR